VPLTVESAATANPDMSSKETVRQSNKSLFMRSSNSAATPRI
jgi:hypothetical protein